MKEETKIAIKNQLPDYLTSKGISLRRKFNCLNPDHDDSNPSMSYNKRHQTVHCFSCGCSYDIFDLIKLDNQCTSKEAFEIAEQLYNGVEVKRMPIKEEKTYQNDYSTYFNICHKRINDTDYPSFRGISTQVKDEFNIGFDEHFKVNRNGESITWKAIIIPTSSYSFVARNTDKTAEKDNRIRKQGSSCLFNKDIISNTDDPIFIVEGEFDALSIHEVGRKSIALGSVANAHQLIKFLKEVNPKNKLIISLDNDEEGKKATEYLVKELRNLKIIYLVKNISNKYKDPNEALMKDRENFMNNVENAIKEEIINQDLLEYKRNNAKEYLKAFIQGVKDSANTKPIPTSFQQFDSLLGGGLYEGLYIIGAISSLGKTTFTLQIADQVAMNGTDVLIFSLEMSKYELVAKSISRLTFKQTQKLGKSTSLAKTTRGITNGHNYSTYNKEEQNIIIESIKNYSDYADHIYIFEGSGNMNVNEIRKKVQRHIELTNNVPLVIIDYLQILSPLDNKSSDKQNTDKSVLELKRISRDFKLPLIAISSFNRSSYKDTVSMEAFKESGAIEYSSDILLGMQFTDIKSNGSTNDDIQSLRTAETRDLTLRVLKNRNGQIGDVKFNFKTKFNYFYEVSGD